MVSIVEVGFGSAISPSIVLLLETRLVYNMMKQIKIH